MIETIGVALQTHKTTAERAKEIYDAAITEIGANYTGALYAEKIGEAKRIYNETVAGSISQNLSECERILDDVADKARKVASMPVSPDFVTTLEAFKNMQNPTKQETDILVGAYKNNYFAYRAICDIMGGAPKGYPVVTIDSIMENVADLKTKLRALFHGSTSSYDYMNYLQGDILPAYDNAFSAFIDGRFEDVSQSVGGTE